MALMDRIKGLFGKATDAAGDAAHKAKDVAGGTVDKVQDVAGDAVDKVKDVAEDVKDRFDGDEESPDEAGEDEAAGEAT